MKRNKTYIEDSEEFAKQNKTYRKVLQHRKKCKKWGKEFCLECFGGGLTQFTNDLLKEMPTYISLELLNNDWLNGLGKENLIRKINKINSKEIKNAN